MKIVDRRPVTPAAAQRPVTRPEGRPLAGTDEGEPAELENRRRELERRRVAERHMASQRDPRRAR